MALVRIDAGTTGEARYTLRDNDGAVIPGSSLATLTLTLRDARSGEIVNSRTAQNVLNTNGVTVNSSGALVWTIAIPDTTLLHAEFDSEEHVGEFLFTANTGQKGKIVHRLFCSALRNLCTFDDVKLQVPEIGDDQQLFVEKLIDAFTSRAQRRTNRVFRKATGLVETFSPRCNQTQIRVLHYPITAIASIIQDFEGDFTTNASAKTVDPTDYAFKPWGIIKNRWRPWMTGDQCVQVTYSGGLCNDVGDVPPDLNIAAVQQVAFEWQSRARLGVLSESVQAGSITTYVRDLLPRVEETLALYRPARV